MTSRRGHPGYLLLEDGKPDEAVQNFSKALELKPDMETIYRDLGHALFQSGRNEAGKQAIARGIALNPGFADFSIKQFDMLEAVGKVTNAPAGEQLVVF